MKTSQTSFSQIIVELHRLYAEFKRSDYLEMAAEVGKLPTGHETFEEIWDRKVREGAEREGVDIAQITK